MKLIDRILGRDPRDVGRFQVWRFKLSPDWVNGDKIYYTVMSEYRLRDDAIREMERLNRTHAANVNFRVVGDDIEYFHGGDDVWTPTN